MKRGIFYLGIVIMSFLFIGTANSQYYNGLQMEFGKSRVQYQDFYWTYYRFDKFDIYFDAGSESLAEYTSLKADELLGELESYFDYSLEKRIIFILYKKHSDFKQSNLGLVSGLEEYNTGGVTKILDNKVMLYYEGDHRTMERQIKAAISEILFTEMLYGGNFRSRVSSSTLLNLPEWYTAGLVSYVSNNWDLETENKVKDGILSGKYKKFNRLTGEDAVYAGHSIWNYIAEIYGETVISNIIYFTKVNKSAEGAIMFVLGISLKDLSIEWLDFYKGLYEIPDEEGNIPTAAPLLKRAKKARVYQEIEISPDGNQIAYTTNEKGQYKIWIYNKTTGKHKKIYKREHKLDQLTDYSYPILAWHPTGSFLTFVTEEKGRLLLTYYNPQTKDKENRYLFGINKVLDYSFSHDGLRLVLSAVEDGRNDLFVYNNTSRSIARLTNDIADDFNPRFINNSEQILFISNRVCDTLKSKDTDIESIAQTTDVFIYNYKQKSPVLTRVVETPYINETEAHAVKYNTYTFLSDKNGIINRYTATYDSTISHIDTITHYRYYTKTHPLTDYKRNIESFDYNKKENLIAEILYFNNRNRLFLQNYSDTDTLSQTIKETPFREVFTQQIIHKNEAKERARKEEERKQNERMAAIKLAESLEVELQSRAHPDSILIDVNNYRFEDEDNILTYLSHLQDSLSRTAINSEETEIKKRVYQTSFYTNYLVSQVDFSFLNTSYQTFTGGPVYFNPGGNMLFKIGTNDLFENYKIVGGIRFSMNFESNEFLLSFENLEKRLDKQTIFHRQVITNNGSSNNEIIKVRTNELMQVWKYPFSQVNCVKGTLSLRYDDATYQATDYSYLLKDGYANIWAGMKIEYIFDNTLGMGLNLWNGTRYKLWGEFYRQVDRKESDLFVVGADFRNYLKIHRNLIFASRFATSTSFGHERLIYYLGSVDNWTNLFNRDIETFDQSIPINSREKYAFQTLATNMRGFTQNIRNGNWFAVVNTEIRWPIIRYFMNRPISNDFLNNFQAIGFFDLGSAWSGSGPSSHENAYNTKVITNGPVTMSIDMNRAPVVAGFGFGLRSRLFGYFVRTDWAWGVENDVILPRIFYLSLNLDF